MQRFKLVSDIESFYGRRTPSQVAPMARRVPNTDPAEYALINPHTKLEDRWAFDATTAEWYRKSSTAPGPKKAAAKTGRPEVAMRSMSIIIVLALASVTAFAAEPAKVPTTDELAAKVAARLDRAIDDGRYSTAEIANLAAALRDLRTAQMAESTTAIQQPLVKVFQSVEPQLDAFIPLAKRFAVEAICYQLRDHAKDQPMSQFILDHIGRFASLTNKTDAQAFVAETAPQLDKAMAEQVKAEDARREKWQREMNERMQTARPVAK